MLLYGGGVVKLAMALFKVTTTEPILWVIWKQANGWRLDKEDVKWTDRITREMREENLVELRKAEALREKYFERLPQVKGLIRSCRDTAESRGYVHSFTGRRIYFKPDFSYKSPNGLIQGGASDVCKLALIAVDKLLDGRKSKLLASVHDEIIVKIHSSEMGLIPVIRSLMETSYPHKKLPLTVGVHIGNNLFEMEKYEHSR
jgi:DNA polymerase I-like protein with 3'-5' exonuclease and polymerase domains